MRWMISYKFRVNGHDHETVQISKQHPAEFVKSVNDTEGYEVVCVYSAVEVPKGFRNTNLEE